MYSKVALRRQPALRSCGASHLRFRLVGERAKLRLRLAVDEGANLEALLAQASDWFHVLQEIADREEAVFRPELVRIVLPLGATIAELEIDGDIALPEPGDAARRWPGGALKQNK